MFILKLAGKILLLPVWLILFVIGLAVKMTVQTYAVVRGRNIVSLASVCRKITSVQRNVVVIHQRTQAKPYISVPQVANLSKERDG